MLAQVLPGGPVRRLPSSPAAGQPGTDEAPAAPTFDDSKWKVHEPTVNTWSSLGLHNYMGSMWYRATAKVPAVPKGKKVYLWVGSTDGSVKVFINGKHVPYVDAKGKAAESFTGHCQPASFDVTAAIKPGADNQISILARRTFLNELGTGGLQAPPVIYRERD